MKLTIRDYSETDIPDHVRIENILYPEMPSTPELHANERQKRPEMFEAKEVAAEFDGEPIGYGLTMKAIWFHEPGRAFMGYALDPRFNDQAVEREMVDWLTDAAFQRGFDRVYTACASRHSEQVRTLEEAGYALVKRYPVTGVDLEGFDACPYRQTVQQVEESGIAIRPLEKVVCQNPDWVATMHDFHCEIVPDIPHAEPARPMPREMFEEFVTDPKRYSLPGKFVALDGDSIVAVSEIQQNLVDPTIGNTMLTGVRREYRRRGIATALKATALEWAQARGVKKVYTDNEERNPMLGLNKALGFHEVFAWLQYYRDKG